MNRNNTSFTIKLYEYLKNVEFKNEYSFLKYYQNIVRIFLNDVNIDSRGLLINFTMGMGKTIMAVAIAMDMKENRQPIVLLTKSLQDNFKLSIIKYIKWRTNVEENYHLGTLSNDDLNSYIDKEFSFVSMNASNMIKQMMKATEGTTANELEKVFNSKINKIVSLGSLDNKLLIIDEAHNLFRAITNGSKNAMALYEMVVQAKNLKLIFLTGTPISNHPFELVPCFNMLGSNIPNKTILPENYRNFMNYFVDEKNGSIKNKDAFQNRIMGLVSFVTHSSTPGANAQLSDKSAIKNQIEFPEQYDTIIEYIPMTPHQFVLYQLARDKEKEEGSGQGLQGNRIMSTPSVQKPKSTTTSSYRVKSRQLSNFAPPIKFIGEKDPLKIPMDDVTSPKLERLLKNINKHKNQLGLVYSQFVGIGGLGIMKRFLIRNGYEEYNSDAVKTSDVIKTSDAIKTSDTIKTTGSSDLISIYIKNQLFIQIKSGIKTIIGKLNKGHISNLEINDHIIIINEKNTNEIYNDDIIKVKVVKYNYYKNAEELIMNEGVKSLLPGCKSISDGVKIYRKKHSAVEEEKYGMVAIHFEILEISTGKNRLKKTSSDRKWLYGGAVKPKKTFAIISGAVPAHVRSSIQEVFNRKENMHGQIISLLLVSATGAEGLDLMRGRHIHMFEPYWTIGRKRQLDARFVRNNSHVDMIKSEKNVQPYIYLSVAPQWDQSEKKESKDDPEKKSQVATELEEFTTDIELYTESIKDQILIDSFISAIREVSIECMINNKKFEGCKVCRPNNQELFHKNISRDIKNNDPCKKMEEKTIKVNEVLVDDVKFYYKKDTNSIYDYIIYEYDETINSYKPMHEGSPEFERIIDSIKLA